MAEDVEDLQSHRTRDRQLVLDLGVVAARGGKGVGMIGQLLGRPGVGAGDGSGTVQACLLDGSGQPSRGLIDDGRNLLPCLK